MKRASGILLPISSIPSAYGIGSFSKEAYDFVDFLAKAGQTYWQILPMGQTGYGDSPYQSCSTFAGNPYFIDISDFIEEGWISKSDLAGEPYDENKVDYGRLYNERYLLLKKAYSNSPYAYGVKENRKSDELDSYIVDNRDWLMDYALYNTLKDRFKGASYTEWPEALRKREHLVISEAETAYADSIRFWEFVQFYFAKQWKALKDYANEKGISIIGDIPIYVAPDSADAWSSPELFRLDGKGDPIAVAGCPPDAFAATGQLWGNPLYDWDYHKKTGFAWWIKRLKRCFELYDIVRIDHFRGFESYYAIPFGALTAENGTWEKGPGIDFINAVKSALPEAGIIAEDLGYLTPEVHELLKESGYPGMKILQFAFDSREAGNYLPYTYPQNCVVYTGTHDNDTMQGWCNTVDRDNFNYALDYIGIEESDHLSWRFIRCAFESNAGTAIIPMQDYLELGSEARINTPSTVGNNWMWRMRKNQTTAELARKIRHITELYGRV